jgi:hypothetical protein
MGHVQKRPCGIPLHPLILGASQIHQKAKGIGFSDLGLVFIYGRGRKEQEFMSDIEKGVEWTRLP